MKARIILSRAAFLALWLCVYCVPAYAAGPSVQITLYDLASESENPVAVGYAPLLPAERRANLHAFSPSPSMAALPYGRDRFYVTRLHRDLRTGAVSFRVRYEQVVEARCTALDIRQYAGIRFGDTCELYSERGRIRAVMRIVNR